MKELEELESLLAEDEAKPEKAQRNEMPYIRVLDRNCKVEINAGATFQYRNTVYRCVPMFDKGIECSKCDFAKIIPVEKCNSFLCNREERQERKNVVFIKNDYRTQKKQKSDINF